MRYKGLYWGKTGWEIIESGSQVFHQWDASDVYLERFAYKGQLIKIWATPSEYKWLGEKNWIKRIQLANADQLLDCLVSRNYS
jgi:hypothetical protein